MDVTQLVRQAAPGSYSSLARGYILAAPTSFAEPVNVVLPAGSTERHYGPCAWGAIHGARLPEAGAQCVVGFDEQNQPTVLWWEGQYEGPWPFVLGIAPARPVITGTAIYVSSAGSDSNSGRSEAAPYATIAKALTQSLAPGDGVLMRGGDTFAEGFSPSSSGTSGERIVFGSYGYGNATLTGQIAPTPGPSYLTFDHLTITTTGASVSTIAGWGQHIRIQNCNLSSELATAITCVSGLRKRSGTVVEDYLMPPVGWEILSNVIHDTGDSGILIGAAIEKATHGSAEELEGRRTAEYPGEAMVIEGNIICRTGLNAALAYGKHGIYLKAKNSTVRRNLIAYSSADGVSQRYSNCAIEENLIESAEVALGFFQYGNAATLGESHWSRNTISNVDAAFYAPTEEASWTGGVASEIPTQEAFALSENRATGATQGNNLKSTKVYDDGSNAYLGPSSLGNVRSSGFASAPTLGFYQKTPVVQHPAIASPGETVAALKKTADELREALKAVGITA